MIINEDFNNDLTANILFEGVSYNKDDGTFLFNFSNDNDDEIIKLEKKVHRSEIFNNCYYFAYEFESNVDSYIRTLFIKSIKFPDGTISEDDKCTFIGNAVRSLDSEINLIKYDTLIYPQSMSELTREMIKYLSKFAGPKFVSFELIKELPAKIEFDYEKFVAAELNSTLRNGMPRYTNAQKDDVLKRIGEMMDNIHSSDYFSIARSIKKTKYRPYIKNYYNFKDKKDKELFEQINNSNVLVVDDIATSGTTIFHLLKTIRSINDRNNITVFSLLGKNLEI